MLEEAKGGERVEAELWAVKECGAAFFGDARLTQRYAAITAAFAKSPECSIPATLMKWKDTKAAYRFFDNDKVSPDAIFEAHRQSTLERMQGHSVILAVQDTSIFNFTLHRETKGLGPFGKKGLAGFLLHSCLAVSAQGVPRGLLTHRLWTCSNDGEEKFPGIYFRNSYIKIANSNNRYLISLIKPWTRLP